MFRIVVENEKGMRVAAWTHPEGKPDHFAHATVYQKIALLKTLNHGMVITTPDVKPQTDALKVHPTINRATGQAKALDLGGVVHRMESADKSDWKTN